MQKVSKNDRETGEIAKIFLNKILKKGIKHQGALVIGLSGELGTGKTAFTQAVAKHLGIKSKISSPTFVIIKKYSLKNKKYKLLFHLDAYRLKNEKELLYLGWEEIINKKEHLVFIEWPENVIKAMPKNTHFVRISHTKNRQRNFELVI
ncbi:MAG: tRNA (adenosine(37)-N6)-threonylcarbamoyltransferase complex ATPase subunit type 1 TsaE [Patescibacteria group bacterium]